MAGVFGTEMQVVGIKKEVDSGTVETFLPADYNIRFQTGEISDLTVEYADDGSFVSGNLTKEASTPGLVRGGLTLESNITMGEFETTDSGVTYSSKYPLAKGWGMAGFNVIAHEPTGLLSTARGWFEMFSTKESICDTYSGAFYDAMTCSKVGSKGIEYTFRGLTSNAVISAESAGKPFKLVLDPKGGVGGVAEVEHSAVPIFDDGNANNTRSIPFINADVVLTAVNFDGSSNGSSSVSFCVSSFGLDMQNVSTEIICASSQYGVVKTQITDQNPKIDVGVLMTSLSDFDWWNAQTQMQIFTLEIVVYEDGAKTLPLYKLLAPRVQLQGATSSDDNGLRKQDSTFMCLVNTQGATVEEKQKDVSILVYANTVDNT